MLRLNVFIQVSADNRAAVMEAAKALAAHFVTLVPKIQSLASMKLEKFSF